MGGNAMADTRRTLFLLLVIALVLDASIVWAAADGQTIREAFPCLSSGPLASAKLATLPKGIVLKSGKLVLKQSDVDAEIRNTPNELWPQLKRNLFFLAEDLATRKLIEEEARSWAKKKGRSAESDPEKLVHGYLLDLTAGLTVTDAEVQAFYDKNKPPLGQKTVDQIKADIRDYLVARKRSAFVDHQIDTLSERTPILMDTAWVSKQYPPAMDNPVDKARLSGQPTLVDFWGAGCKPCEMMKPIMESLATKYAGKLQVIFFDVAKDQFVALRYGASTIPVQALFDKSGALVFRHVGTIPRDELEAKIAAMGIK
jgi:thioredoxin 1